MGSRRPAARDRRNAQANGQRFLNRGGGQCRDDRQVRRIIQEHIGRQRLATAGTPTVSQRAASQVVGAALEYENDVA
jgi:hypothetical protein